MLKLLVLSIDGRGMGHLNRTMILAHSLKEVEPSTQVRFLAESPACGLVRQAGFDVLKLPDPMHRLGKYFIKGRRAQLEAELMSPVIDSWLPDGVMLDFVVDEGLFKMIHSRGCKVLLVLRRLLPGAMAQLAKDPASRLVDTFVVPHMKEDFSPGQIPAAIMSRCVFTGPLVRKIQLEHVRALRKRYAPDTKELVLVTLGGGGWDGAEKLAAQAWKALAYMTKARSSMAGVMVCGPLFEGHIPTSASRRESVKFEAMLPELMVASDAVVCSAGYNSVRELEACGTPGLLVPISDPGRDDQEGRARRAVNKGMALMAHAAAGEIIEGLTTIFNGVGPARRKPVVADQSQCGRILASVLKP